MLCESLHREEAQICWLKIKCLFYINYLRFVSLFRTSTVSNRNGIRLASNDTQLTNEVDFD